MPAKPDGGSKSLRRSHERRARVLLVDRDAESSAVLRDVLTLNGFVVDAARTLGEARELLQQKRYTVLVLRDAQAISLFSSLISVRKRPRVVVAHEASVREIVQTVQEAAAYR